MWSPEGALCAETDPELFFPDKGDGNAQKAKSICDTCDVLNKCLLTVIDVTEDIHGIRADMSYRERREFRRDRDPNIFRYLGEITDGAA